MSKTCDYCGRICDPSIKQRYGDVPGQWRTDGEGSYHNACLPTYEEDEEGR